MPPKKVCWAFTAQCPVRHTTTNLSLTLALTLTITQNQHITHPKNSFFSLKCSLCSPLLRAAVPMTLDIHRVY